MPSYLRGLCIGSVIGASLGGGIALLQFVQTRGGVPFHDASAGSYYLGTLLAAPVSLVGFALGDALLPTPLTDAAIWPFLLINWALAGALFGWRTSRRTPRVGPDGDGAS